MGTDRSTLLFFDASCLVAAAGSATGGSRYLLNLCAKGYLRAVVSQPVLMEAETNIAEKMPPAAMQAFREILASAPMLVAPVPGGRQLRRFREVVSEKDEHVVAAATASGAPYLLTLDQRLAQAVNKNVPQIDRALPPGEFIRDVLPTHPDFPSLR